MIWAAHFLLQKPKSVKKVNLAFWLILMKFDEKRINTFMVNAFWYRPAPGMAEW